MVSWIVQNAVTIVICICLAALVTAVTVKMISDKKKGRSSCCRDCSGCAASGSCRKKK